MNGRSFLSSIFALAFVCIVASGCGIATAAIVVASVASSQSAKGGEAVVLALKTTGDIRAKYVVFDEITKEVISQGLTPDTVALAGLIKVRVGNKLKKLRAKYRVEITHPDTEEVYSEEVEGEFKSKRWLLSKTEIKSPF